MIELTIQEVAEKTGLPKEGAYSLMQFLQKAGLTNKGSSRMPKSGKGKGVSTYLMADTMPEAVREMLAKLTQDDGSAKAADEGSDDAESTEDEDLEGRGEETDDEGEEEDASEEESAEPGADEEK
jgi:hypothetical protein